MGCLYCGKDIGPFRIFRDDEFCSDGHRKRYVERLGRALSMMGSPEPAPTAMAPFRDILVPGEGPARPTIQTQVRSHTRTVQPPASWPLAIDGTLGSRFREWDWGIGAPPAVARSAVRLRLPETAPELPPLGLGVTDDGEMKRGESMPPASESWMPVPDARVATRTGHPAASAPARVVRLAWLPSDFAIPRAAVLPRGAHARLLAAEPAAPEIRPRAELWPAGCGAGALRVPAFPAEATALTPALHARFLTDGLAAPAASPAHATPAPVTGTEVLTGGREAQIELPALPVSAAASDVLHALRALTPCEEPNPGLAALPAEREVGPAFEAFWCAAPHAAQGPVMTIAVAETDVFEVVPAPALSENMRPGSAAECALREVRPASAEAVSFAGQEIAARLPEFILAADARPGRIAACTQSLPGPSAEPAGREVQPGFQAVWAAAVEYTLETPSFALGVAETDILETVPWPAACEQALPVPSAEPAAREIRSAAAEAAEAVRTVRLPAMPQLALPTPGVAPGEQPQPVPGAAPAVLPVWPHAEPAAAGLPAVVAASIVLPSLAVPRPAVMGAAESLPMAADIRTAPETAAACESAPALRLPGVGTLRTAELLARSRAVEPHPASRPMLPVLPVAAPAESRPETRLPQSLRAPIGQVVRPAGFREVPPETAAPAPVRTPEGRLQPVYSIRERKPVLEVVRGVRCLPETGFIPVEFYCQRAAAKPSRRLDWATPRVPILMPGFGFAVWVERSEDAPPPKPAPKADIREILSHPDAKRRAANRTIGRIVQIAAAVLLAVSLWFAYHSVHLNGPAGGAVQTARAVENAAPARAPKPQGTLARVRNAIAGRAAYEVTDTLHGSMESWGAPRNSRAPGWLRQPGGYTRVGDLELFRPSLNYEDYRLEFLGQVESKGMGWVVRAQDKQNYYAMKFRVIESGLRPVIALVHYPVVGGRKGHTVETPLSLMVHRNMPFRVQVDVKGNRLTASVEGQSVESWTDDLLARGAVGFFSEAGERARLYWMKISKNQDWLGVVCSFLAGSGETQTAAVGREGSPARGRVPDSVPQGREAALAEAESSPRFTGMRARARSTDQGRIRPWIC